MPTPEQEIQQLVKRGIAPSEAERIVREVEARGGRLRTPQEADAAGDITDTDIERARAWWFYQPRLPRKFRRILEARTVKNG